MKHNMAKLIEEQRGRYLLVNSLARRVRALQSGSKPLVGRGGGDLNDVALSEFRQGKVLVSTAGDYRLTTDEEIPEEVGETEKSDA